MALFDFTGSRRPGEPAKPVCPAPIQPMETKSPGKARLVALIGTAAAGLIAVVSQWEGKSNDPYQDIVKVWTVCYGETNVEMRRYTDAQCKDMLAGSLTEYATAVLNRNPELKGHDPQVIAASSLTYNIGGAAYARSSVAKHFDAGKWRSACDAMLAWNRAGGKVVQGLKNRREAERKICLREIPAEYDR